MVVMRKLDRECLLCCFSKDWRRSRSTAWDGTEQGANATVLGKFAGDEGGGQSRSCGSLDQRLSGDPVGRQARKRFERQEKAKPCGKRAHSKLRLG